MSCDIKITAKGQITLPKKIRTELALKTGEYLRAEVENGRIVLKPIFSKPDDTALMKYAESEGKKSIGLEKVRELTERFQTNMEPVTSTIIISAVDLIQDNYIAPIDSLQFATALRLNDKFLDVEFVSADYKLSTLAQREG